MQGHEIWEVYHHIHGVIHIQVLYLQDRVLRIGLQIIIFGDEVKVMWLVDSDHVQMDIMCQIGQSGKMFGIVGAVEIIGAIMLNILVKIFCYQQHHIVKGLILKFFSLISIIFVIYHQHIDMCLLIITALL